MPVARKAYSDREREPAREALLAAMHQCIADQGRIYGSVDALCRKAGISNIFLYSLVASKEELVLHARRHQQPKLLGYAGELMEAPELS